MNWITSALSLPVKTALAAMLITDIRLLRSSRVAPHPGKFGWHAHLSGGERVGLYFRLDAKI